jgi:hypothetical protein
MSTAALRSSRSDRIPARDAAAPRWGTWIGIAAAVLLAAVVAAWFMGWISFWTDPRVVEIQQMQAEAQKQFTENGGPKTVAEATAAMTTMNTIRAKVEALPPHLRPQVELQGGNMFRNAMRARIDAYFALPPEKRQAEIDRQIDQEEVMRKAFEAGRAVAGALGGGQGGAPGAGASGNASASSSASASSGPSAFRSGSEEDRNRFRKSIIDRTTPEQRARYVEYRRAMEERREQRGLPGGWGR